jgi:hypothetical protein
MKPNKKRVAPEETGRLRTVDEENYEHKTNEQEADGGAYARPRKKGERGEDSWRDGGERPNRGG